MDSSSTSHGTPAAAPNNIPVVRNPDQTKLQVSFYTDPELVGIGDPYFRGFDNQLPDFYREAVWEREFDQYVKNGKLPALELIRLMHDHMGNFSTAIDGVNTPELQQADNDYAVAKLIEKIAHSPYKYDTLICILEDDAQDGADHVDAHRSTAYFVGPYVKHGVVISKFYSTVNMLRTIEDILGTDHLSLNTATQSAMTEVFDLNQREWDFTAKPSAYLANTQLPIPKSSFAEYKHIPRPTHNGAYWADKTKSFNFNVEDQLGDPQKFNRIIWRGLKGNVPYPDERNGADLSKNRVQLLKKAGIKLGDNLSGNPMVTSR
jgi:hypothetical protein